MLPRLLKMRLMIGVSKDTCCCLQVPTKGATKLLLSKGVWDSREREKAQCLGGQAKCEQEISEQLRTKQWRMKECTLMRCHSCNSFYWSWGRLFMCSYKEQRGRVCSSRVHIPLEM